jgi:dihydrolipoamide dehydrogenase
MYDLGIIGAGPAGYVAAERAGHKGLKTVLFDEKYLGGVCLNEGCIPTKTLLYSAKLFEHARHGEKYGILADNVRCDYKILKERKDKVVKTLVSGVGAKMKKNKVEVVMSRALITGRSADGITIKADGKDFSCKNILIATGSEPFIPAIPGLDRKKILTSREILEINTIPEDLVIIGGGVIGMEFANLFNSLGSKVTVIEMMKEILGGMDEECAAMLRKDLEKRGMTIHTGSKVTEIIDNNKVVFEKEGKKQSAESTNILVSVGRKPVITGFGLENLGVEQLKGGLKIDDHCRTNLPNVYAAGDVTGFSLLAHTASREAEVAVNNIVGKKDVMRYNAIPGVVYTNPEVSGVGLTEQEAKNKNIKYKVRSLPMVYAGRFIAENEGGKGLCKVIVGDKYEEILGVHMIGNPSSEMIFGAAMAIEAQLRISDLKELVFPHPTVSEILKETFFEF